MTIYAITSMVSGTDDQGADPNRLVTMTDTLSNAAQNFSVSGLPKRGELLSGRQTG